MVYAHNIYFCYKQLITANCSSDSNNMELLSFHDSSKLLKYIDLNLWLNKSHNFLCDTFKIDEWYSYFSYTFIIKLIIIIIMLLLLILAILSMFNLDDENTSLVLGTNTSRRNRSLPISTNVSSGGPNGDDNGDDNEDDGNHVRNTIGELIGVLFATWISMKKEDIKSAVREESTNGSPSQEEHINRMSDNDVKNTSVIKKPIDVNTDFGTNGANPTNSGSILRSSNVLYHPEQKHYDPLDSRYKQSNIVEHQNIETAYSTSSGKRVKTLFNDMSTGIINPSGIGSTIPPSIQGLGDSSPTPLPRDISMIQDPYMLTALKVITLDVLKDTHLSSAFNSDTILDVKKLNDLKTAFLMYKAAGNSDLSWEKVVSLYAHTFTDREGYTSPLPKSMEEQKAYMNMLDFVNLVYDCRERDNPNFVPYSDRGGIHHFTGMDSRRSR